MGGADFSARGRFQPDSEGRGCGSERIDPAAEYRIGGRPGARGGARVKKRKNAIDGEYRWNQLSRIFHIITCLRPFECTKSPKFSDTRPRGDSSVYENQKFDDEKSQKSAFSENLRRHRIVST